MPKSFSKSMFDKRRGNGVTPKAIKTMSNKVKKKLPLTHPWRRDKIGQAQSSMTARDKAVAEVKRRRKEFEK
jgi:hypothetical protein